MIPLKKHIEMPWEIFVNKLQNQLSLFDHVRVFFRDTGFILNNYLVSRYEVMDKIQDEAKSQCFFKDMLVRDWLKRGDINTYTLTSCKLFGNEIFDRYFVGIQWTIHVAKLFSNVRLLLLYRFDGLVWRKI